MSNTLTFRAIDEKVNQAVENSFDIKRAILFGVNDFTDLTNDYFESKGYKKVGVVDEVFVERVTDHGDIYMMLESDEAVEAVKGFTGFGVLTCGWAAPIGDDEEPSDGPPSEHPQKRRVKLFCFCDSDGQVTSSLRFQDDPDEVIIDKGSARGSLADAVHEFNERVRA